VSAFDIKLQSGNQHTNNKCTHTTFAPLPTHTQPEEFEKDDLSLGHVAFATAAANLRCHLYGLPSVDQLQVQRVAGKIVPALATTTALVAGLVR